jgi:hypothetical protein
MYIPSIYKSIQHVNMSAATAISAVDTNYSRLTIQGFESTDQSGAITQQMARVFFNSTVQIGFAGQGICNILVEEYYPAFFRQVFFFGTIAITPGNLTGTNNTGLTLGSKAYVHPLGSDDACVTALSKAVAQITATLSINTATGVVTATRYETLNVPSGDTGDLTVGFMVIDPR